MSIMNIEILALGALMLAWLFLLMSDNWPH